MAEENEMSWRRRLVLLVGVALSVLIIVFTILDINDIPSRNGFGFVRFDWVNILATMIVGFLTLYFTINVAETQEKIESNKIASEKFFEVRFVEKYQKIVYGDNLCFRLKIKELKKDLLKNIKISEDVIVTPIVGGKQVEDGQFLVKVDHEEHVTEHTDDGMDKDWLGNDDAFCFVRIGIIDGDQIDNFKENSIYRIELQIVARDIFGVEVKCKLCPWFKVESKNTNGISFSLDHSFGYYDSVRYVNIR